jgi:hypothetical protein
VYLRRVYIAFFAYNILIGHNINIQFMFLFYSDILNIVGDCTCAHFIIIFLQISARLRLVDEWRYNSTLSYARHEMDVSG